MAKTSLSASSGVLYGAIEMRSVPPAAKRETGRKAQCFPLRRQKPRMESMRSISDGETPSKVSESTGRFSRE